MAMQVSMPGVHTSPAWYRALPSLSKEAAWNYCMGCLGGLLYLVGGPGNRVLCIDPYRGKCTALQTHGQLPVWQNTRSYAAVTYGTSLVVVSTDACSSGCEVDVLNRCTCQWLRPDLHLEALPAREGHSVTKVDECICIFGGNATAGEDNSWVLRSDLWTINLQSGELLQLLPTAGHSSPSGRSDHAAAAFGRDKLVVHGGSTEEGLSDELWMVDTTTGSWQQLQDMGRCAPGARSGHCLVAVGVSTLLLFGGVNGAGQVCGDVWLLQLGPDPGNGLQQGQMLWQQLQVSGPAGPPPRQGCAYEVGDNCFFIAGGYGSAAADTPLADVWTLALTPDAALRFAGPIAAAQPAGAPAIPKAQVNVAAPAPNQRELPPKRAKGRTRKPKTGEAQMKQYPQQQQQLQQQQRQPKQNTQQPQQQQLVKQCPQLQLKQLLYQQQQEHLGQQQQQVQVQQLKQQRQQRQEQDQDQDLEALTPMADKQKVVTAYALFLAVRQPQLAIQNPDAPEKILKGQLRDSWKALLPDEREVWKRQARRWNAANEVEGAAVTAAAARGMGKAAAAAARARGLPAIGGNMDSVVGVAGVGGVGTSAAAAMAAAGGQSTGNGAGGAGGAVQPPHHLQDGRREGDVGAVAVLLQQQTQRVLHWQQQQQEVVEEQQPQADDDGAWENEGEEQEEVAGTAEPGIGLENVPVVQNGQQQLQQQQHILCTNGWQAGIQIQQQKHRQPQPQQQHQQLLPCMNGWQTEGQLQQQKQQRLRRKTWPNGLIDEGWAASPEGDPHQPEVGMSLHQHGKAWLRQQPAQKQRQQQLQQKTTVLQDHHADGLQDDQLLGHSFPQDRQQGQEFQASAAALPQQQEQEQLQGQQQWEQQRQGMQPPLLQLPGLQQEQQGWAEPPQQGHSIQASSAHLPVVHRASHHLPVEQQAQRHQFQQPSMQAHGQLGQQVQQQQMQLGEALSIQYPHLQQQQHHGCYPSAADGGDHSGVTCGPAAAAGPACVLGQGRNIQSSQPGDQQALYSIQEQRPSVTPAAPPVDPVNSPLEKAKLLLSRQQQAVLSASVGRKLKEQQLPLAAKVGLFQVANARVEATGTGTADREKAGAGLREGSRPLGEEAVVGGAGCSSKQQQQEDSGAALGGKRSAAAAGLESRGGGPGGDKRAAGHDAGGTACGAGQQQETCEGPAVAASQQLPAGGEQGRLGPCTGAFAVDHVSAEHATASLAAAEVAHARDGDREAADVAVAAMLEGAGSGMGGMHHASAAAAAAALGHPQGLTICAPSNALIGAEITGVIEGIAGSGYIARVKVGGAEYQAVLFSPYLTLAAPQGV